MSVFENHSGDRRCSCVADHHPEPAHLEKHHIWPLGEGGPDVAANVVWICPTTHTNAHLLEGAWKRAKGQPTWDVRRRYNYFTRELARRAYQSAQAGALVA